MSNSKENNISFLHEIEKMIIDMKNIIQENGKDKKELLNEKVIENVNEKIKFLEALGTNISNKNNEELKTILEDKGIKEKLLKIKKTPEEIGFIERKSAKINDNKNIIDKDKEKSKFIEDLVNTDVSKQIKSILNNINDLFKSEGFLELIGGNGNNNENIEQMKSKLIIGSSVDNKDIVDKEIDGLSDNMLSDKTLNNIIELSGIKNNDKKEKSNDKDGVEKEKSNIKNALKDTVKDGLTDPTVFTPQGFAIHLAKNYGKEKIKDLTKEGLDGGVSKGVKEGFEKTGKEIVEGIKDTMENFINSNGHGTPISFIGLFSKVINSGNEKINEKTNENPDGKTNKISTGIRQGG